MEAVAQVARNLLAARERNGLTQEELSALSGVHPTEVSRIENAHRDIQISTAFKLAKALDLTPGQLIDGAVNSKLGLPSAAGHNTAILKGTLENATGEAVRGSE